METDDQEYSVDAEGEIRAILEQYQQLDADATVLNLLNDENQHDLGILKITPELDAIYQNGTENGLQILEASEQETLKLVWEHTTDILPKELFANFKYFKVGGDGEFGTFAYVIPLDADGNLWCMAVDPADITEDHIFPYTVVHEMGHYLTLNADQVDYYQEDTIEYPIDRYADSQCVAKKDSYLQAFYALFWKEIANDWATDPENIYFYYRHQSQFVTAYSATDCTEDLAECFSAYVLLEKSPTEAIQRKFDFFDQYPEFRALKDDILKNIEENNILVNPEIELEYGEASPAAPLLFLKESSQDG
jgi:hypothetical protein